MNYASHADNLTRLSPGETEDAKCYGKHENDRIGIRIRKKKETPCHPCANAKKKRTKRTYVFIL
jgi:hypothetical protein